MKETTGTVFSIPEANPTVPGCTISKQIVFGDNSVTYFSLAEQTDISAELYPYFKLILVADGELIVFTQEKHQILHAGDSIITETGIPVGMRTELSAIYTEISIRRNDSMNPVIKPGEIFKLASLVPYQEGKIVNMDVASNPTMKFVIMSFDAGTGLSEHAAPGEALIFALDGEGIIQYEGKDYPIKAGENFSFEKGGMHAVKAEKPFKMALFLTLS